jgi:ABC-type dipeptide/oligopeptide/nickel transport system permease component
MTTIRLPQKSERNPVTQRAHGRQTMWQIVLPLVIGAFAAIALGVLAGLAGADQTSRWADISLIFMIVPALLATLLFVVLFAGLNYGLFRVLKAIPPLARRVQDVFGQVEQRIRTGADMAAEPFLRIQSLLAAARSLRQQLRIKG